MMASTMNQSTMNKLNNQVLSKFKSDGKDKRFLGQDLEVVCFIMATEIERLHDVALEYQTKFQTFCNQNADFNMMEGMLEELAEKLNKK